MRHHSVDGNITNPKPNDFVESRPGVNDDGKDPAELIICKDASGTNSHQQFALYRLMASAVVAFTRDRYSKKRITDS
ncbi:hypothetical protein CBM2586_A10287 [Cupriavidus phytorum]|uniref:Uncharacterized protein n=1 Tax=Cupriavidus taiwanensis TaxID=164546 RepID=A0A375B9F4_9BURK|nr:hypothetical protein CBM2586_A10287 [Cupriavidus taiwanensis]